MTDNEIIKALECCNQEDMCDQCPYQMKERFYLLKVTQGYKGFRFNFSREFHVEESHSKGKYCRECGYKMHPNYQLLWGLYSNE